MNYTTHDLTPGAQANIQRVSDPALLIEQILDFGDGWRDPSNRSLELMSVPDLQIFLQELLASRDHSLHIARVD